MRRWHKSRAVHIEEHRNPRAEASEELDAALKDGTAMIRGWLQGDTPTPEHRTMMYKSLTRQLKEISARNQELSNRNEDHDDPASQ